MSVNEISQLLAQLNTIQSRLLEIQTENKPQYKIYINLKNIIPNDKNIELYRTQLDYSKAYFLITCTFEAHVANQTDIIGQGRKLDYIIDAFNNFQYFACHEKHKSGILHSHILIDINYHTAERILTKYKKHITTSLYLKPAIKIDAVKQSKNDIDRTYDYIWKQKKDHPDYKYIKINI